VFSGRAAGDLLYGDTASSARSAGTHR